MAEAKENRAIGDDAIASEENQASINANDGGGFRDDLNAGETINGATLPVAICINSSDGEVYACDANDTTKLNFIGFAISNSTNGNPINIQTSGVVRGFSGLTAGVRYYVQDDKTLGTSVGTYEVFVGIAISATEIAIQKGARYASGIIALDATEDTVVTLGWKACKVNCHVANGGNANAAYSYGGWTKYGGNQCVYGGYDSGAINSYRTDKAWWIFNLGDNAKRHTGVVSVSATAITFSNTMTSTPNTYYLYWEAIGE